ncbi:hypothetical protein AB0H42_32040 [Nocardia sp. NPDC050799]|uniref:hypothetical protein n=1 Tax=Nocardia sp. NPDC050799 TaxID=3154842 RepID=UPI00340BBBA1
MNTPVTAAGAKTRAGEQKATVGPIAERFHETGSGANMARAAAIRLAPRESAGSTSHCRTAPLIRESATEPMITYLWARCLELDIGLFGVAEFPGYPGMIPGTSLVDWDTGEPNARYHATKLMVDHTNLGDRLVPTITGAPGYPDARVHAQAIVGADGRRRVVLVNKRSLPVNIEIGDWSERSTLYSVDASTPTGTPTAHAVRGGRLTLPAHASAVLVME